jgi:hypothetical protein
LKAFCCFYQVFHYLLQQPEEVQWPLPPSGHDGLSDGGLKEVLVTKVPKGLLEKQSAEKDNQHLPPLKKKSPNQRYSKTFLH